MEPKLKSIRANTYLSSLPLELINELEQFRMCELRTKSRVFIKSMWLKDELDDHINEGLTYKNLDTNETKDKLDNLLKLDSEILNIENSVDYVLKYYFLEISNEKVKEMINNGKLRGLASQYDDYFSLVLKLKSGPYVYIDHQYGSGSKWCCHTLQITVCNDLDKLINQEIPETALIMKYKDFNKLLG